MRSMSDAYPVATTAAELYAQYADDSVPEIVQMWREIGKLRQWNSEAMTVLAEWERVWELAGKPGKLGSSKSASTARLIIDLREQNAAWMNGVADVVESLGYDRHAACGPADLLPGLTDLRVHDMEMTRRLAECVEARRYLYEQLALSNRVQP